MKLHLPKSLRTALLTCLAALAPVAVTLATGAISSGLVAFSISSAYAVDETGDLTSDTNWNATTDHSAYTTTVSGATLKVGNGSGAEGSVAANGTVNLGKLTLTGSSTMNLWAWTSTDKDVSTDGKVNIAGELTLNNSNIWVEDGSYYFSAPINVVGSSVITSQWAKGIVIGTFNGDDDASLTLRSQGTDPTGALFTLGVGTEGESSFNGTLILDNSAAAEAKTTTLALNDSVALKNAALQLNSFSNVIIMLDRVLVESLYGSGDVAHSYNNATGHASPVVQITGNATESQLFSGTVASTVTWQIGDGTTAASSRFSGATLNGALNIQANSTAYLTGSNTFGSLTNNGTLYLNEGSSFSISSVMATEGATITVGSVIGDGLVNNAFAYGNGWTATYDGNAGTATLSDTAVYWSDGGTDDNIAWSDGSNWSSGSVPASTDGVRLTADNAGKNIAVTSNVTVQELRLYGAYTMDISGSFTATDGYRFYDSASLTKNGTGTLNMTSAEALAAVADGKLTINAGTLHFTDTLAGNGSANNTNADADFSSLSIAANASLSIIGAERNGDSNIRTTVKLGSGFAGKLIVKGGWLDSDSDLGGASALVFEGGNLLARDTRNNQTISTNIEIGATGTTFAHLGNGGNGTEDRYYTTLSGSLAGSGDITFIENGDWYLTGDMSGFTGSLIQKSANMNLFLRGNAQNLKSFSTVKDTTLYVGTADNSVTVATGTGRTQNGNFNLDVASGSKFTEKGTLNQTGGTFVVKSGGTYEAQHISLAAGTKLDVQGASKVNILGVADTAFSMSAGEIAIATDAVVSDSRALTLDGNLSITGAGTYKQLGSLTISDGTTLTLSGKVTLTQLDNNGVITLANSLSSLTLVGFSDQTNINGRTYEIGTVTDGADKNWNALLGVTSTKISYDATTGLLTAGEAAGLVWADLTGDTENSWNEASNWQDANGNAAYVPYTTSKVVLGAGTAEGYDNTVTLTGTVEIASLTVQSNHNISVAADDSATLTAAAITLENGATLTKTGAGTLVIGKDVSAFSAIAAGTLKLDGTFGGYDSGDSSAQTAHDLTRFTGSGTLAVSLFGSVETNGRSLVSLSDSFTGTLEVCAGALDRNSLLGGTTAIKLNNGGLFGRETATNGSHDFSKNIIVEGNSWLSGQGGGGEDNGGYYVHLTGAISGDGELSVKGLCDWHFKGDMSGFTGSIKLESGTGENPDWVIFHSNADLSALTMNVGNLKVTDNALLAVETLSQTGGAINVASGASLELKGTATLKSISNSGVLKLQNADSLTLVGFNDAATTVNGTQTFTLGSVENATEINWNTLTGVSIADYRVKYSGGTVSYASATDTYIVWADTDDEESAWGEGSNWRWADDNSLAAVPTSAQKVQLTADAAHKTITLSGATSVAELNVQGAYELNVAEGNTATLSAANLSVGDSGSLTKAGTGTLTMSKDNATAGGISISEGTLKLSESSYANSSVHDLSSITASADGTLQMNGSVNPWSNGSNLGISVILSDDFEGTLKMTSGQLNVNNGSGAESVFGGAKAISLEGATVAIGGGELSVPDLIFNGNNTTILSHGTSTIASDISGSGTINRHGDNNATLNLTGDISYDGTFIQQKATLNLAGDNAAYIKNLKIQGGAVTISSGLSSDSGLTVTGGTTNLNGSSDLGIVSMSNGTFGVNATTQIDELSVTGGTFKINGAEVNVGSLKSGALTLTGAADLTAVLADTAQVTLNGAATADATLSVVAGGSATLSVAESLKSLTVTEGGVLALSGTLTLGDLYNTGTLNIANLSALTIGGLDLVDGSEYEVGTLTGADAVDWNTLLGLDSSLTAAYNGSKIVLSLSGAPVLWVGDAGSTWDEADENGDSTAWKQGENAFTPGANTAVVLGNAASLGDLNDAVTRTIVLDADTVVGSVTVQDAYSLSVAEGGSYSFDAGSIVLADGGSLSKTGAGTLSMSLENAVTAQMNIAEGTLSISETLTDSESGARVDLTALSGAGTLSITAAGESGVTGNGTGQRSSVDLADSFTGTLAVVGGNLDMASTIGGTGSVLLDGATLVGTGSVVQELGWNIAVSDKGAYLRRFGYDNSDGRGDYATRLTGALTGSAYAMLKVIDAGEWFLAGDMSGYQGGMSIEGNTNYVTFESNATLASLTAANNSHILVDNNATLTAPALAVSGTIYTGATEGATFNMGAVTIADNGTLNISGAGEHTATSVDMSAATTSLTLGENAKLTVSGLLNGDENGDTETLNITLGAGAVLNLEQAGHKRTKGTTVNISLGANAVMTDAAWRRLGNSSLSITGTGVYNLAALQLSNGADGATNVTIGAGATLHITGTDNNNTGDGGALLTGTNNFDNTITVSGTLALECGISRYNDDDTANTINVTNEGKLAFNRGLTAANEGAEAAKDIININGGGVLEVSGTNVSGTNRVTVNVAQNGIVMGGNANDATESKIANNLNFDGGAYIGAKKGTTLTLAPEDGSTNLNWLDIIGTADTQGIAQGAGGKVVFDSAVTVVWNVKVLAGAEADFNNALTINGNQDGNGLYNYGKLTVDGVYSGKAFTNATGAQATFNSGISLLESVGTAAVVDNSGKLTVNGTLTMYHFNNNAGAEAEINGDVRGSSLYVPLIYNSGKVSFNGNVNRMHQIRNLEGGEMTFAGEMNGSYDALQNAGKLVFDGATVRLENAILNGGTVEILNAADTQFVLNNALLEEIVGVSKTWTLVNNTGMEGSTGSITGWDALGLENFLLDGSTLQLGDWDDVSIADGKVMLYMLSRYWDATGAESVWNTGVDANWRESVDSTETVTFESNSRVTFSDTDETGAALDKSVTVADAGVHAKSVTITGTGYVFSGGKVLVNQSLSALHDARFDSAVVIGSAAPLQLDVADGATLTLSTLETVSTQSYGGVSYGSGAFSKTGKGTLLITDAINGTITGATVSGGKLVLGVAGAEDVAKTVSLVVGSNTLTTAGGSLENVELLSSGTVTDYTGATVQANNVIKSADGVNYAVLTDVALRAGAATGYASLQKVTFAGNSTLSGYITYESTKQQRQMAVATGGTLTVSNLTFDLHGLSTGTKVLIENGAVADAAEGFKGTLEGWNSDNVTLLYSGIAVNSAAVNMGTAGVVALNTAENNTAANMYWDGLVAGAASSAWDKSSANWSASEGTDGSAAFLALSNAYFGVTPEGGSKAVNAAQDMVMSNMFVTEGGYSFTGSRLATLGNMSITPASGAVSFANELVAQGNVTLSATQGGSVTLGGALQAVGTITASGEGNLSFNSTVQSGGDITIKGNGVVTLAGNVSTAGKFSIGTEDAAVMDKADASTLYTIAGTLTAKDILINMDASTHTAAADEGDHLVVSGNVSAMGDAATPAADGTITLLGSAAKKFTGYVTADTLRVNAAHDTLNNVITFTNVVDVNTLEIAEDTYVRIVHADSDMDTVLLGGTLYMDTMDKTYDNGYDVYSTSDSAELVFGTISTNIINLISGLTPAEATDDVSDAGQYNSISVNANTRFLTVNALADLKDLTLYNGPMTVKAGEGAIHGNLVVRDAAGLVLTENANNIMAEDSGSIRVDHANMNLNSTTQTLRSGNDLYLASGAITGNASGVGLNFVGSSSINYTGNSTVSANMTVADGKTLTLKAGIAASQSQSTVALSSDDTLLLSGALSGTGSITMQGDGRVLLSGANTAYTGAVTVQQQTSLKLGHVDALAGATLNLAADGTLLVDRAAVGAPFNIGTLNTVAHAPVTLADGTTLTAGTIQIHSLQAMDAISAADAAFNVGTLLVSADQVLNLTLSFAEGESLQTMKTYNLFTSSNSLSEVYEKLNVELYIATNNIANNVASSQYKLVYDATANVIAIRTMLGNIWDGGTDGDGDGTWSTDNTDKNWSGSDYVQSTAYNDAIFADLTGEGAQNAVVTIQGTVNPGDVYFESGTTVYELNATADGAMLAAGNVIHKAGAADVTLNLANNGSAENALGGMDLQAGDTLLAADLAVKGEVSVAAGATLQTTGDSQLLMVAGDAAAYTAQGTYSGLTMDAAGIAGVADAPGTVTNGLISGAAELSNLNLTGTGTLTGVTIGSGVNVATDAAYTLAGAVTFNETLVNSGTVTLDAGMTAEIGQLGYSFTVDDKGASWYTYQLVKGGTINGMSDLLVGDVTIGGVSLGSDLAEGVATYITNKNGSITLSIGNVTGRDEQGNVTSVDGSIGVPQWDERWCDASKQPSLSRRYAGTTADTNVSFAEGITDDADYYWYSSVVNAENANKVNGTGNEVVVTLSSASTGARAAGGSSAGSADLEMWVYDRSGFTTVVAGQFAEAATGAYKQNADTHVLVNSTYGKTETTDAVEKTWVVGGSWNVAQNANSYVTVQDGKILTLVGGSVNSNQTSTSYVYIDGGRVFEVVGASYADNGKSVTHKAAEGETLASHLVITGGNLGGLASDNGTKSVYGGGIRANITGDIKVTVDGTATITNLVGGNYGGSITGNITMNLVSGTVNTVNAAGAGNASVTGNVSVYLSRDFDVSAGLFGGKQNNSGVTLSGTSTLYLTDAGEYVFAQWQGDDAGTHDGYNYTLVEGSAVTIAGFDVVSLAQDTVLTVDTRHFDRDITGGTLVITGNGIVQMGGKGGETTRRDIRLENGATFKLLSSYTVENFGADGDNYKAYSKLYVTDGTTFDISGYPRENSANDGGGSIAYHVYLSGDGVDGMGALYKGATEQNNSTNPNGKAALGYIELTGNASATAEHNISMIGPSSRMTYLDLNGYTFTKRGEGAYVLRNTEINGGTYYAHEGTVQPEQTSTGADADLVLAASTTLKLNDDCNFTMRSLTGAGDTELGAYKLTLAPVSGGKYYAEFMKEANSYDNLMSGTGFAYGVYSGKITGVGSLYIGNKTDTALGDRTGVQYLSGTDSTYSGGTHVEAGRLYLLSSTQGSISKGGSSVTSGPIGTGALYWDSTKAEVYLGHGVTVYNAGGTNVAGSDLILGVEGAPDGDLLKNYPGVNGTVVKDGVTYHEVDTHNLQSISCDGVYADGTAYVAGTEIDRNKMLLVTEAAWNSESSKVKGFTDTGYNEATYSGVLSGAAALVKVGAGTLVIDQANAYTGGTRIEAGTLKLKGWAQIGAAADGTIDVEQTAGSTLMLAYDGTYGDELTSISNNMVLKGTGDARWEGSDETGGDTAALISDVGSGVTFTLSGDISGDGNLLHSGEGTLVLSGDSSFTGGTHATRGVVEVQSSMGLGSGAVKIDNTADLHVTVEEGTTDARVTTTLATAGTKVQGDVVISGTESTERILNVATGGYDNSSTTLHDNGTLLVNGKGVTAATGTLSGSGTVAVSDATGSGASATVDQMTAYTGDFVVEGNKASITVENGSYSGGSISVSGNDAVLSTKGDITITNGESLSLSSRGNAGAENDAAYVTTTGSVSVASGATLSVSDAATSYEYNLQNLQAAASLNGEAGLKDGSAGEMHAFGANTGADAEDVYSGFFNTSVAMNQKAAGAVKADRGLTLAAGATYETAMANTSLLGGTLTLDAGLSFATTLDLGQGAIDGSGRTTQLVLFSDVSGVNFVLDDINAVAKSGIYYTKAENYISGSYIDEDTWLVYDSGAGVVYLDGIVPEPTTATLSLLALAALAARRRRK